MKSLRLLLMCLLCAGVCAAQSKDESERHTPPGLVTLKLKWERHVQGLLNWDRPIFDATRPGDAGRDDFGQWGGRNMPPSRRRPSSIYYYEAEIRNDDAKKIKGVIWEYVLVDPESKRELGRHKFYSAEKVGAKKKKTLRGRTRVAPSRIVSAVGLGKDKRSPYDERVEFRCVLYDDGTFWRRPAVAESECVELKDRRKMRWKTWMNRQ